ncbi:hypothetical protein LMG32879_001910 [Brytella acorum]|uniref:Uncharacterized protein n=1 Tax=Brytella acorum TaxID=2959299 RepID=A0AA35VD05_9PROT|nr:hypothetical protein LMG32879_001910 [Brytella acorum]
MGFLGTFWDTQRHAFRFEACWLANIVYNMRRFLLLQWIDAAA